MAKIIAFEEIGEVETYDLEVEHKDHQYYLANGVLTSNSHAVAYSAISFQCAWLLTYYPAEWLSAYLNEETESKLEAAIAVVKQMGYTVHPPNINISTDRWEISKDGTELYQPLTDVKGFGDAAYEQAIFRDKVVMTVYCRECDNRIQPWFCNENGHKAAKIWNEDMHRPGR